jgi:hypothetical protein
MLLKYPGPGPGQLGTRMLGVIVNASYHLSPPDNLAACLQTPTAPWHILYVASTTITPTSPYAHTPLPTFVPQTDTASLSSPLNPPSCHPATMSICLSHTKTNIHPTQLSPRGHRAHTHPSTDFRTTNRHGVAPLSHTPPHPLSVTLSGCLTLTLTLTPTPPFYHPDVTVRTHPSTDFRTTNRHGVAAVFNTAHPIFPNTNTPLVPPGTKLAK